MKLFKNLKQKKVIFFLSVSTLLLILGACGKVRFELDRFAVPLSVMQKIEENKVACSEAVSKGLMQESTQDIFFPKAPECEWNENGNYSKVNRLVRARQEQYVEVDLPEGAVLCDMEFDFPEQTMTYDDEIFLTLSDKILFASTDYSTESGSSHYATDGLAINTLGLVEYKWDGDNGLANLFYDWAVTPRYCLGVPESEYDTKCVIPATETTGRFYIDIDKENIIQIGTLNGLSFDDVDDVVEASDEPLKLGFITTGDNDKCDCEHSDFEFQVKVKYVIQPEATE